MKVQDFYLEESKVNKGCFVLVAITEDGEKFVVSGNHHFPTYLEKYEDSFDLKNK